MARTNSKKTKVRRNEQIPREWDPNYYCLRRPDNSSFAPKDRRPGIFVSRETLLEPLRIERLRWKACVNYQKHLSRNAKLIEEIADLPNRECFIPPPSRKVEAEKSYPERVYAECDHNGVVCVTHDSSFWNFEEPEHDPMVDMEVLAAAAAEGKWRRESLPEMLKRASDPVKLAVRARYQHETDRGRHLRDRHRLANDLLAASIINSDLLPKGPRYYRRLVRVRLNDRVYFFKTGCSFKEAAFDIWPEPDDFEIIVTGKVKPAGTVR